MSALVEVLLRHFHNDKKKKPRLPNPKGLARNSKMKKKKLHCWQMMRRHGGVKLHKGGCRAKLKFSNKRMQLGSLKN